MIPDIYRSTDTNAPNLSNANGSLVALLDAVLITGYTTQSITGLTHSAGTITATKTAHGYSVNDIRSISGAAEDEYNGRITVLTVPDADHFTYAPVGTNPGSSPATGTILGSVNKAGLGWQTIFTASNKRVYRPRAGSRMYLRVDDSGNVYEALVRGAESFSDIDTFTGGFPTTAQLTNGDTWQKTINTAGNRAWRILGDDRTFFFNFKVDAVTPAHNMGYFGDYTSYKVGDAYNCALIGKAASTTGSTGDLLGTVNTSIFNAVTGGHYTPRSYTQIGSSLQLAKLADARITSNASGNGTADTNLLAFPDRVSGAIQLSRFYLYEAGSVISFRGYLRGLWCLLHSFAGMTGAADGDAFVGGDALSAQTFELAREQVNGSSGAVALETPNGVDWT